MSKGQEIAFGSVPGGEELMKSDVHHSGIGSSVQGSALSACFPIPKPQAPKSALSLKEVVP